MNQRHPVGCQCDACLSAEEEGQEEEEQPVRVPPPPPVAQPKRPRGRPPKPTEQVNTYTRQIASPAHHHARYEYEYGEMRRCHLCAVDQSQDDAMKYSDEPVWFASLEDRARHILEIHTDASIPMIRIERQRAKEILGIKELWDTKSPNQTVELGKPIMSSNDYSTAPARKSVLGSLFGGSKPKVQSSGGNWFLQHKLLTVLLVGGLIYVIIIMYMMSQGYSF